MIESTARVERISPESSSRSGYLWEVSQKPVSVSLPFELIDRMERLVVENFRSLTSRGSEIGGLLLGRIANGSPSLVELAEYELVQCDYSRGPLYRLSDADMARFERAIEQHSSGNGLRAVGYFRGHTRKGLSLDPEDVAFLDAHFKDANNIALLVRPYATKASTAAIFIRENGVIHSEASYHEFPFRASQLTASASSSSHPSVEEPPAGPVAGTPAAPAAPAAPKPSVRAQIVPIASRREITMPPAPQTGPVAETPHETAAPVAAPVEVPAPAPPSTPAGIPVAPAKPVSQPAARTEEKPAQKEKEKKEEKTVRKEERTEKPAPKPVTSTESGTDKKPAPEAKPTTQPAPPQTDTQEEAGESKSRKGLMIVAAVALLAIAGGGYFFYPRGHKPAQVQTSNDDAQLNLHVEHDGPDLLLTWNRDAAAIKSAVHGVLTISDGDRHENYDMDPGQLGNGSIVYSPITADVSFRLEVTGPNGAKVRPDTVRMLRTRPSPMPDEKSKSAAPTTANGATPQKNEPTATPTAQAPATEEAAPAQEKLASPTRAFDSGSLAKRVRQATASDLPDAPTVGRADMGGSGGFGNAGLGSLAPPPAPKSSAPAPPGANKAPGGQISQAQLMVKRDPEYPKLAQQMGVRGSVELIATIGTDGKVKAVKILKGPGMLQKPAQDAVMQWVYKPTLLNGIPVENETHITINFANDR